MPYWNIKSFNGEGTMAYPTSDKSAKKPDKSMQQDWVRDDFRSLSTALMEMVDDVSKLGKKLKELGMKGDCAEHIKSMQDDADYFLSVDRMNREGYKASDLKEITAKFGMSTPTSKTDKKSEALKKLAS